jgi:hypothetical protein
VVSGMTLCPGFNAGSGFQPNLKAYRNDSVDTWLSGKVKTHD